MEQDGRAAQNAGHAEQASQWAHEAASVAPRGSEVVADIVSVQRINASSQKIGIIVHRPASPSDNITAKSNAAVEAARVPRQNRAAAAVVASEVRGWRQRSADVPPRRSRP
ncbi:MAG: hypothetical protein KF871_02905 [Hydrogenophaga sp.]|uniref:hypothetical protein n=1 Tax=Hydrogenophaga sp. TaxID=1904254 RepID=UPI001D5F0827|nr:hypothetical protein [Hydrogenophaga sp.]MBX3608821.1 hypothetical protein [Hydrogenophaga sp.]